MTAGMKGIAGVVLFAVSLVAHAEEECFLVEKVCTEPAETRRINGSYFSRDCWAYKNVYTCITKSDASEDGCSTLNAASQSYACDKTSYACDESMLALNGTFKCLHETENWQCTNKVTLPAVNAEWTGKETVYDERIDSTTCQAFAADASCVKGERTCSESGKLADGYGECTQTYKCNGRYITACTALKNAGCTETAAPACEDGSDTCGYKVGTMSCEGIEQSDGTGVSRIPAVLSTDDYTVTATTYPGGVERTTVVSTSDCLAYNNGVLDSGCTETSSVCSVKGGPQVINGKVYFERCWGYTKLYTCVIRDFSSCGQLETNAVTNLCTLKSETCESTDEATGTCLLKTKVYSCSDKASAGEGVLTGAASVFAGYETNDGCATEEKDSTCQLVGETCESYSSEGDGVCVQSRRVYKCKGS